MSTNPSTTSLHSAGSNTIDTQCNPHVDPNAKIALIVGDDIKTMNATAHTFMQKGYAVVTARSKPESTVVNVRSPSGSTTGTSPGEASQWIVEHVDDMGHVGSVEKMFADVIRKVGTPNVVVIDTITSTVGASAEEKPLLVTTLNIDAFIKDFTRRVVAACRLAQLAIIGFRKRQSHASQLQKHILLFTIDKTRNPSLSVCNASIKSLAESFANECRTDSDGGRQHINVCVVDADMRASAEKLADAYWNCCAGNPSQADSGIEGKKTGLHYEHVDARPFAVEQ
ncbi:uncharacterized protein SPPG_02314 [Spizellomyces punctatus DAOM BR117]|uniref:Uncharacterized protein n=1 Tax=Spizellomyces punctatus (strain DAOM BR117) TaxID=645134 RepID=A0A0L0HQC8_SPIPD|nr:uncharacterized protein SPPG_02314 [Spizellomyces punctatus DAOM BR117]KND03263.1 hypothetical protein SPPG_02314 [Spizellomyces punctatus DAOM BR117]|eukprot:XP_016611302.1 hypothetical protein SPPG_02314 [Spizellomyces punctatus DAOM BR117]